ncbi:MAG TPA: O-antigen ligase family protein [Candidatus Dormibacteraeota bacterium]|nr:O-antigen ligase family protein [Candidatus Dormibacteraeota bacterium]
MAPAYGIRWHYGFYPTTLLEHAIVITVLVFAIEWWRSHERLVWRSPYVIPTLVFVVAGAISVVTAPSLTAGLGLYRAYLLEPIAFALVLMNVLRTAQRAALVAAGLGVGATVAGLANSYVVFSGLVHHTYQVTESPPVVIYMTANAVALFVVPIVALALSLALYGSDLRQRWIAAAFVVIGTEITALSFSRGGYLALAAVVLVAVLLHPRRWVMLALAVVALAAVAVIPPIRHRIVIETQNVYGNTVQSRIDLWTAAVKLIEHRPILGAGLSGFQTRGAPYYTHLHTLANFIDPHNIVLNFWVETGLLGLIAFTWLMVVGFMNTWKGWREASADWAPFHLGVLLALVAVVVHGMVDVPYFKNDLSLLFWTMIGLTLAGRQWGARGATMKLPQTPG